MKFNVTFKRGVTTINTVIGVREVDPKLLTVGELNEAAKAEQIIERLTGIRVHIEQVG